MTKQELREHLFDMYAANLSLCHPHVKDTFLCPFCLGTFGKEAVLGVSKRVILAHCTPEALDGRLVTLACASCDCSGGHEIDIHLVNRLETDSFLQGMSPNSRRVWFKTAEQEARADFRITIGPDGRPQHHIRLDGKRSRPGQCEAIKESMQHGDGLKHSLNVTQRGQMIFRMDTSRIAMLRAAYLLMFRQYGYSYVLHPNLHRLREQFKRSREAIIPGRPVVQIPANTFAENTTVCVVTSPQPLQAFLAVLVFRTEGGQESVAGVFMPGLGDDGDSIYERIQADQESKNDLTLNFVNLGDVKEPLQSPWSVMLPYEIWAELRS
jgi:hypothetical protein